jgi:hypothetical protein
MKAFKILVTPILILGIIYYQLDKRLFFYGRNDLRIYHLLPFKIVPDYQPKFEGGFALREEDEDGFSIAGNGVAYPVNGREIWINSVVKYGFNAQHLVAVVCDSNKTKYYVKFNQDSKASSGFNASMEVANKPDNFKLDKWIDIDDNDDYVRKLVLYRNYLELLIIILFLSLIYRLIKHIKFAIGTRLTRVSSHG